MADFEHFTPFEENMDIIQRLGDNPNTSDDLSADELKAEFDKGGNLLKTFVNGVVEHLNELVNMLNNSSGGTVFSGGTMIGPLNMNRQNLYGLSDPTDDDQAVNKAYADAAIKKYSDTRFFTQSVTLQRYGWSDNAQAVSVPGVTEMTDIIVSGEASDSNWEAYTESGIRAVAQGDDSIRFQCDIVPSVDVTVNVLVRRAAE